MTPSANDLLALASQQYEVGKLGEAEQMVRAALAQDPQHGPALHLLGIIAYDQQQFSAALEFFARALATGVSNVLIYSALGATCQALGRYEEALDYHQRSVDLAPDNPLALNNWGITLVSLGRSKEAVAVFRAALRTNPNDAGFLNNLAGALNTMNEFGEAAEVAQRALRLAPLFPQAFNNLGSAALGKGQMDFAIACFRRAAELDPQFFNPHVNLGHALTLIGNFASAEQSFQRALQIQPLDASAYLELSNMHYARGALDEAEEFACRTLQIQPKSCPALTSLALARQAKGLLAEARNAFEEVLHLQRDDPPAWSRYISLLNYDPAIEPQELLEAHRRWAQSLPAPPVHATHAADCMDPDRPLRVGYVSPDFRNHASAFFIQPILQWHDPRAVEVFCYSELVSPDAVTHSLRTIAPHWRDTFGMENRQVADLIRSDRIDILVDLAGHTTNNRLLVFLHKPAPIQVSYLGYPSTTGLPTMDYRLVDAVTAPEGEPNYDTEELFRLPVPFACYAPAWNSPNVSRLPVERTGVITFGSMHKLEKLNVAVLDLWAQLLHEVPSSRLLLVRHTMGALTAKRLTAQFEMRGIGAHRLAFYCAKPMNMQHLQAYEEIDIALDAFPWNGHTTACEALWMGVPVVALRGRRHSARMTASVLTAVGLKELIAEDEVGYRHIAARLAADIPGLASLRRELRGRMAASPLCDGASFTRNLEAAYRALWQRWCAVAATQL